MDYVCGLAKVPIHQSIAAENLYANSEETVDQLYGKFDDRICPTFFFKDIDCSVLGEERVTLKLRQFDTVTGSSSFHCMVFSPGNESFIAAKLIFICDNCKVNYGSCEKFKEYSVNVGHLNKAHSRSNDALLAQVISTEDDDDNTVVSFLTSGSIIAIAADRKTIETFGSSRSLKLNVFLKMQKLLIMDIQLQKGLLT